MSSQTLYFGVLLLPGYQWLDSAGAVDYLNNHSQAYMKFCGLSDDIIAKGPILKWYYISSDFNPIQPTSGPPQHPTHTYADCPHIDYLIVPGPDPALLLPEGCAAFLQNLMAKDTFKALLTVCTGSLPVAQSGILDGLRVCSNKFALKAMASAGMLNKKVHWVGDRRWNVDGKVWSAAGITSGIDLAAEFARVHFDPLVVEIAKDVSEYEPKPSHPDPFARILDGVSLS